MAADIRENANAGLPTDLSQAPAGLIRKELELILADVAQRGRQVGVGAGLIGGAGVLGVGAFAALTSALIAAIERRPARGAFLMAAIYGAGAGTLTEAGVNRLKQSLQASAGGDDATEAAGNAVKGARRPAKAAKSSAKAVRGKSPAKAAAAGKSSAKAARRKSPARAARSA